MYIYTVQTMPGQKAKFEGDTSVKYQVKRVNTDIPTSKKGRTEVIRTNLEYEEAITLIERFNSMEEKSQNIRVEETPLFLRNGSEGQKGDAQDEKDETEE